MVLPNLLRLLIAAVLICGSFPMEDFLPLALWPTVLLTGFWSLAPYYDFLSNSLSARLN